MTKGRIHRFVNRHPWVALVAVVAVALIVTPFDEILILGAIGLFGVGGVVVLVVLIALFFLGSRKFEFGQRWYGKAYGTLEGLLTRLD